MGSRRETQGRAPEVSTSCPPSRVAGQPGRFECSKQPIFYSTFPSLQAQPLHLLFSNTEYRILTTVYVFMKHIGAHISRRQHVLKATERGELMKYFCEKLNPTRKKDGLPVITMARMGKILEGIPTKDLYYLKRVCNDAPNFSKRFWWELDPRKHQKEA